MTTLRTYVHATPSIEDKRLEAWVTVAGHYICNDYQRTVNGREVSLLAYCINGSGTLHLGDTTHHFARGDLMLQPAHMRNTCNSDPDNGWEVWWIMFGGTHSQKLLDLIGLGPTKPMLTIGYHEELIELFQEMYAHLEEKTITTHMDASLALIALLYRIHKRNKEQSMGTTDPFRHVHYLNENVEQMAAAAGYSKHHYIRMFKQATGMPPWQYVLHLKVDKAKDLLLETRRSIKEVSALVGFQNPLYFSRLFRKLTGKSPSQFRIEELQIEP